MGRFLTQTDMSAAKHTAEVFNAVRRRGEVKDAEKITSLRHVVCGCGQIGCIFMSATRSTESKSNVE